MNAKIGRQEDDPIPAWQTIYCSLMLIMLVLFVMLSSYSIADKGRMVAIGDHIRGRKITAKEQDGKKVPIDYVRDTSKRPTMWANDVLNSLQKTAVASGMDNYIVVEKTGKGLKCRLMADAIFSSGNAMIRKNIYPYLNHLAKIIKENNTLLRVEGYTDNLPVSGGAFSSNWELSMARAMSVLKYFREKGKISADQLTAAGFGQYHPRALNDTPQGRMQNRRIEIFLEGIVN